MLSSAKRPLKIIVVSGLLLGLLLCSTEPTHLPSAVLIVPYLLIFCVLTALISYLVSIRSGVYGRQQVRIGAFGAALPTLLLVLQSVGQLTMRDALTIVAVFVIAYFYLAKRRAIVR